MRFNKIFSLTIVVLALSSCAAPTKIAYFQDLKEGAGYDVTKPEEIRIQPKDKLSIIVNSQDPRLMTLFNLAGVSGGEASASGQGASGYTVDSEGNIDFPVLGKLQVSGMTREEVATYVKDELQDHDLLKEPIVIVEFMNLSVSVLGEVNTPGRYNIDKENLSVLDVLSQAGDLTIYGQRENVMVLRYEKGKQKVYNLDLCSAKKMYASPAFYLQQNDVIYVTPNDARRRQSTTNGVSSRNPSLWVSLASTMTSIAVLIVSLVNNGKKDK